MKKILVLLGFILCSSGLQAQGYLNVSGGGMNVTLDAYLNITGTGTQGADYHTENNGQATNFGNIYIDGNYINNNPNGTGLFPVVNPFLLPTNGTVHLWGYQKDQLITGRSITFFNNLTLEKKDNLAPVPKIQEITSVVDAANVLRIDGVELRNNDIGKRGNRMIVTNNDPRAIEAPNNGFVSAEDDADNSDSRNSQALLKDVTYSGGRLEWWMSGNGSSKYIFPVGHRDLPEFRRDVEITVGNDSPRKFMVRCVAKSAEDDGYIRDEVENKDFCRTNRNFYHVIDDSTGRNKSVKELTINYKPADGVFDDVAHYEFVNPLEKWEFLESTHNTGINFAKDTWDDFEVPIFALSIKQPLKGLTYECIPPPAVLPCEPRVGDQLKFADNPDNEVYYTYQWLAYYVNPKDGKTDPNPIGRASLREPVFPDDFGITKDQWFQFRAAEIKFELRVINPADPGACFAENDTNILFKPRRAIYVPTAFSPNGSDPNNIWKAWFYGYESGKISIYNRWGLLIYSKNFPDPTDNTEAIDSKMGINLWDGKTNGGSWVPEGAYVYKLELVSNEENTISKFYQTNGTVTIVR